MLRDQIGALLKLPHQVAALRTQLAGRDAIIAELEGELEDVRQQAHPVDSVDGEGEERKEAEMARMAGKIVRLQQRVKTAEAALRIEREGRRRSMAVAVEAVEESKAAKERVGTWKRRAALEWDAWIDVFDPQLPLDSGDDGDRGEREKKALPSYLDLQTRAERLEVVLGKRERTIERLQARLESEGVGALKKRVRGLELALGGAKGRVVGLEDERDELRSRLARVEAYVVKLEGALNRAYRAKRDTEHTERSEVCEVHGAERKRSEMRAV